MPPPGKRSSGWKRTCSCGPSQRCSAAARRRSARPPTRRSAPYVWACPVRCRPPTVPRSGSRCAVRSRSVARCIRKSIFARKNYFYPDLPKGYQISQFDSRSRRVGRCHFSLPSAASSTRASCGSTSRRMPANRFTIAFAKATAVDLNRSGVPLIEIVGGPRSSLAGGSARVPPDPEAAARIHRHLRLRHGEGQPAGRRQRLGAARGRDGAQHAHRGQETSTRLHSSRRR